MWITPPVRGGGGGGSPFLAASLDNISTTDLPTGTVVKTKTNQTVEEYMLKSGCIYKFEVWGAKGGKGANGYTAGAAGGNGSHAVGWYDMRSSANTTAKIFAGGLGATGGTSIAGWGATTIDTQLQGTPGGNNFAHGGGEGGGNAGKGGGQNGGNGGGANGATQTAHGATTSGGNSGTDVRGGVSKGKGGSGGGAGGGYTRGFGGGGAGSGGDASKGGGGGSGGTSYIGGVQSLADTAGKASTTWAESTATGVGKVVITEYVINYSVDKPANGTGYTVTAPSATSVTHGGSYTFVVTRTIGTGDIGLKLSANGTLSFSTNNNVITYTISNVTGAITASDFSTTSYDVAVPSGTGYTILNQSATSVLNGGTYSFVINLQIGYAMPMVSFSGNGKLLYSGVDEFGNMTVTISNVQGAILASDINITTSRVI